jgi:UDP-glucose 4-epimerase
MIYNLGNGHGHSVREVIDVARAVTGVDFPAVETARRPGDADILIASSERISRDLGWEPRIPDLKTIIASAWTWHTGHPRGYAED